MPRSSVITAIVAIEDTVPSFSPADIAGLQLWLDASDESTITESGGAVSQWDDKSGNAYAFTQVTGSLQPTTGVGTQNSLNVLTFAGDYLKESTDSKSAFKFLHDGTAHTIFAVFKYGTVTEPNAAYFLFGTSAGSSARIGAALFVDDRASISRDNRIAHVVSRGVIESYAVDNQSGDNAMLGNAHAVLVIEADPDNGTSADRSSITVNNGTPITNNTIGNTPSTSNYTYTLQIGAPGDNSLPLTGEIAEILFYDVALSTSDREAIQSYLADKWGITI